MRKAQHLNCHKSQWPKSQMLLLISSLYRGRVFSKGCLSVCSILKPSVWWGCVSAVTSPNFQTNKKFLCGAETQLLDLKVHITALRGSHWPENTLSSTQSLSHTVLLADIINSLSCDWSIWVPTLACAGFDSREVWTSRRQRALWDVEKISTCCRGYCAVFCCVSPYLT